MRRRKGVCMGQAAVSLQNEYENNDRFRRYVDRYSGCHNMGIPVHEALRHEIVRQICLDYKEENRNENLCIRWESIYGS